MGCDFLAAVAKYVSGPITLAEQVTFFRYAYGRHHENLRHSIDFDPPIRLTQEKMGRVDTTEVQE
jgi:hypothetical protein